jgi:ubiquinone/menaquinone biosynthesis C-methylase UbiE
MDDLQIKSEISDRWNNSAETYDTFVSHGIQTEEEKQLWINTFLNALPPGEKSFRVLDVGCGTGAMGLIFAEMGHDVTGIDLSGKMMDHGRRKATERDLSMTFLSGDAENPPFPENHFDVVINRHLLWTLPHPEKALLAWRRIVRPGGRVIVIDGVWNDGGFGSTLLRNISQNLGRIFDPKKNETLDYSLQLQSTLPHLGGVSEEKAKIYFTKAGLDNLFVENLIHIRRNQHFRVPWYQKFKPMGTYYLISGTKRE